VAPQYTQAITAAEYTGTSWYNGAQASLELHKTSVTVLELHPVEVDGHAALRGERHGDPYAAGACAGVSSTCVEFLNPKAFAVNPVGTYGTAVKSSLVGPDYFNWDLSLARRIAFNKRVAAELRLDFFNVLNHANFNDPSTSVGSSSFGRITGAMDPRIGQLSLKVSF
jgi:hypothetical protein